MSPIPRLVPRYLLLAALAAASPGLRAGEVTSNFAGDRLILNGDAGDDLLAIAKAEGGGPQDVVVAPGEGTTLDGGSDPITFPGVAEIRLFLQGGNNVVTGTDVTLTRSLNWQGGGGADQLLLIDCTFADDLICALRTGNDRVELRGCTVLSTLRYLASNGNDTLIVSQASEIGELVASLGADTNTCTLTASTFDEITVTSGPDITFGATVFSLLGSLVAGDVSVRFGTHNASVTLSTSTVEGRVQVRLGGRDDQITSTGLVVGEDLTLKPGGGSNNVSLSNLTVAGELRYVAGGGGDLLSLTSIDVGSLDLRLTGKDQGQVNHSGTSVVAGAFDLKTGADANVLNLDGLTVGGSVRLSTAGDGDVLNLQGTVYQSDLKLFTGPGDDVLNLSGISVGGSLTASTAGGDDVVNVDGATIEGNLTVLTAGGDDTVNSGGTTVGGSESINLGSGEG